MLRHIFSFGSKDKIRTLINASIDCRTKGKVDPKLLMTLLKRRKEVVNFVERDFRSSDYVAPERYILYELLSRLFYQDVEVIKPLLSKLVETEETEKGKRLLLGLAARQSTPLKRFNKFEDYLPYLRKNAERGHADAQRLVGMAYEFGWGVVKDRIAAREWYQKAAAQGHSKAQAALKRF